MLTLDEILGDFRIYANLVNESVGVNSRSSSQETPLHFMAYLGDVPAITTLLNAGASIDAQDATGHTPLHAAISSGQGAAVVLLVQSGAQTELANVHGVTSRMAAQKCGVPSLLEGFYAALLGADGATDHEIAHIRASLEALARKLGTYVEIGVDDFAPYKCIDLRFDDGHPFMLIRYEGAPEGLVTLQFNAPRHEWERRINEVVEATGIDSADIVWLNPQTRAR